MPHENRFTFWGDIDQSTVRLEEVNEKFARLWTNGEFRMRPEDIARMEVYLGRLKTAIEGMRATAELFAPIALPREVEKK